MRKIKFYKMYKRHPVRHTYLAFTRVKLYERGELNSEPSHLWYGIFSVGSMQQPLF